MHRHAPLLALSLCLACGSSTNQSRSESHGARTADEASDHETDLMDYDPETLVRFELVADVDNLQVGTPATIGALFHIQEDWHIYWINPGDSGLPTKIRLADQPGALVESARFPGPSRFDSNGEIINYGYHHELLVPMRITATEPGADLQLQAEASWLACREDACVPGKGQAALDLPRGAQASRPSERQPAFVANDAHLPRPLADLTALGVQMEILPDGSGARVAFIAPASARLELFPLQDQVIGDLTTSAEGLRFVLIAQDQATELAVLSVRVDGEHHYFTITSELLATAPGLPKSAKKKP